MLVNIIVRKPDWRIFLPGIVLGITIAKRVVKKSKDSQKRKKADG